MRIDKYELILRYFVSVLELDHHMYDSSVLLDAGVLAAVTDYS